MRVLLRLVAILCAASVLLTVLFLITFARIGLRPLLATGTFGVITVIGWLVTFIAGPIAAVQLFRLRNSGRIAATILFGSMLLYYLVGVAFFRQPNAPLAPIVWLCVFLALLVGTLLSPPAKRTCIETAVTEPLLR